MRNFEDYEDEIYYLRSQNKKYEHINNELLMERNLLREELTSTRSSFDMLSQKYK